MVTTSPNGKTKAQQQAELRANLAKRVAETNAKRLIAGEPVKDYNAAIQNKQKEIKTIQSGGTTNEIKAQEQYNRDVRDGRIKTTPSINSNPYVQPQGIGNGIDSSVFNSQAPKMGEGEDPIQYQMRLLSWQRDEARAAHVKAVGELTATRETTGVKNQKTAYDIDQLKNNQAAQAAAMESGSNVLKGGALQNNANKTTDQQPGDTQKRVTSQYQKRMDQLAVDDTQDAAAREVLKNDRKGVPFRDSKNKGAEYSILKGQRSRTAEKKETAAQQEAENTKIEEFNAANKDGAISVDDLAVTETDKQIADINANVVGQAINPYTGGVIADGTLPKASGFGKTEFFPGSQDESDADQFLRLGEKFGISPEILETTMGEVDAEAEEQKMIEEKINSDNRDSELAIIEAEKIRQAEASRQAKKQAAEILEKSDDRSRGILSRFGATESTAGAAIFAFSSKAYQEAMTQLEVEDAVFNKEMLAATLSAQIRFNQEKLTIEKEHANDKTARVEKTREFAMEYMKQFLDYRKGKEAERFKVGELVFKEQMTQAREDQKVIVDSAMNLFDEYGDAALPQLQTALEPYGIDLSTLAGRKSFSQLKNEYDTGKPYYNPQTGKGGGSGNGGGTLKGISQQLAQMVTTGQLAPDQVMSTYFGQFEAPILNELGYDMDEALFAADASGFVAKYQGLGLIQVNEDFSTQRPLFAMIEDGTITFEEPTTYITAIQDELDTSNSNNRAQFTAGKLSGIVRAAVKRNGVMSAVQASPQYYQTFDQKNDTLDPAELNDAMSSMGLGGKTYADSNFQTTPSMFGEMGGGFVDGMSYKGGGSVRAMFGSDKAIKKRYDYLIEQGKTPEEAKKLAETPGPMENLGGTFAALKGIYTGLGDIFSSETTRK